MQYQQKGQHLYGREQQRPASFPWDTVYRTGYFDDSGNIKCELLVESANRIARELGDSGVTFTQLRRFFGQVRCIERELGQKEFPQLVPQIQSLEPMVANYVGRAKNQAERAQREIFKQFIDHNVRLAARDERSFRKGFIPHFESVVAYYKYNFPNK